MGPLLPGNCRPLVLESADSDRGREEWVFAWDVVPSLLNVPVVGGAGSPPRWIVQLARASNGGGEGSVASSPPEKAAGSQ